MVDICLAQTEPQVQPLVLEEKETKICYESCHAGPAPSTTTSVSTKQLWDDVGDAPEKGTNNTTKQQEKVQGTHDGVWEPVIALSNPVNPVIPTKSSWMTHQETDAKMLKAMLLGIRKNCLETSEMGQQVTQLQTSLTPSVRWQGISDSHKLLFKLHMHICLHTYTHR